MTVSSITPVNNYAGNGSTTTFDFDFLIENEDELKVQVTNNLGVQTTLTLNTDYTIHETGNEAGSYITFPKAGSSYSVLASDEVITLSLDLEIEQEKEIKNSSKLNLVTLEWCLDYLTRLIQVLNRQMERAIKVQESTSIDTETLINNINNVSADLPIIEAVNANQTNINAVNENKTNIDTVATNNSKVTTVANNIDEVVGVEGISAEIVRVDSNKTNINTVAGSIANVNTVGTDIEKVNSVANDISNIDTVSSDLSNINAVSNNTANINAVANNAANINAVNANKTNIDAVNANKANIDTVANDLSNTHYIKTCSEKIADITTVSASVSAGDIEDVADNITNVNNVGGNINNVNAVAGSISGVNTVASDTANINTAAANIDNIKTCASNITDIQNASTNAATSKQYAIGYPTEPAEGSAKYWASQASQGQIQTDWEQTDTSKKDYIKNKPTKLSDFTDDTATNPIDKADTLTDLTATSSELNILDGATLSTTELNYVKGVTSSIQDQIDDKANIICYSDRDFEYENPKFITADKSTITILAGTYIKLKNGVYYAATTDRSYSIASVLDTGSVSNGKEYYFYLNNSGDLVVSLNETAPTGYTTDNTVLIGGGHTLCVAVTSSNAPSLPSDSFWTSHPAIGYAAGDFIPNSVWTVAFKSLAKTGNKGQVLIDHYGIEKFWVDIYLQSGTGTSTASTYSGTITNSRQPILHQFDMDLVGKKLPTDNQFMIFAEGSNQCTNISGSAIPSDKKTGGYTDTAGKRMISGFFVECCCGYLWQWGEEIGFNGQSGWSAYAVTNRGQSYGMPYVLPFGGTYDNSSCCGSWARVCSDSRASVSSYFGGRGVSCHFEKQHK